MRVCHVVRQYHPSVGGLETFVATLAASLNELGCESSVLTLDRQFRNIHGKLSSSQLINGVEARRVPMFGHPRFFLPLFDDAALAGFDVIHVHGIDGMFDRLARYRRRPGQVLVATTHGLFFHTPWMLPVKRAYLHTATRLAASRYDLIIANSASDLQRVRAVSDDVVLLPNAVTRLGAFKAEGRDLLALGRLARHKHVERIVAAMAQPALRDVRLHVVGPEWDVTLLQLAQLSHRLGVSERVQLHGPLDRARLAAVARQCGVFASASSYEGFGMSLVEAMSVGLVPVVQSNAAFVELMSNANVGALTDFTRLDAAARALRGALDALDPLQRERAMAYAQNFAWPQHAETTLKLYRNARDARLRAA
ncbi:MAG: glycosyltransferase family 4 protein [Vitreimonas sp.]